MKDDNFTLMLARQPIFNHKMQIYANELQYQNPSDGIANLNSTRAEKAAAQAIISTYTTAGDFELFDNLPVFIKVSIRLLLSGHLLSLPPTNLVLDIYEDFLLDDNSKTQLSKYKRNHFQFCLTLNQNNYRTHPCLAYASYLRLDLQQLPFESFKIIYPQLRQQTTSKIVISGVDSPEQLQQCQQLQVSLLQGHFINRPVIVKDSQLNQSQAKNLQLVSELQNANINPKRIAQLLSQSPQLSYRLLRLINSATYGLSRKIESLQEAVIYLGLDMICHWISLMLLAEASTKPQTLVLTTLIRAQMSEVLCHKLTPELAPKAFLVGLFSTLDAMLDISMVQALARLPLSAQINQALLAFEGELGTLIRAVIDYEQGRFTTAKAQLPLADFELFIAYGEAVMWAKNVCKALFD